jgi:nucleoid DNA-binding protein
MQTITKEKIIEKLKNEIGLSGVICEEIVNKIFSEIFEITESSGKLGLKNFGSFYINNKKSRPARNLRTNEEVTIAARKVLRFLPSQAFKASINKQD